MTEYLSATGVGTVMKTDDDASKSWNASHPSRGCSQDDLRGTGGDGLFYCFAVK